MREQKTPHKDPSPVFSGALNPCRKERRGGSACCCFCHSPRYIQGKRGTPSHEWHRGPAALLPAKGRGRRMKVQRKPRVSRSGQAPALEPPHTAPEGQPLSARSQRRREITATALCNRAKHFTCISPFNPLYTSHGQHLHLLSSLVLGLTKSASVIWSLIRFQTVR